MGGSDKAKAQSEKKDKGPDIPKQHADIIVAFDALADGYTEKFIKYHPQAQIAFNNARTHAGNMYSPQSGVNRDSVDRFHNQLDELRRAMYQLSDGPNERWNISKEHKEFGGEVLKKIDAILKDTDVVPEFRQYPKSEQLMKFDKDKPRNRTYRETGSGDTLEQIPLDIITVVSRVELLINRRGLGVVSKEDAGKTQEVNAKLTELRQSAESLLNKPDPDILNKLPDMLGLIGSKKPEDVQSIIGKAYRLNIGGWYTAYNERVTSSVGELEKLKSDIELRVKIFQTPKKPEKKNDKKTDKMVGPEGSGNVDFPFVDPSQFPKFSMDDKAAPAKGLEDIARGQRFDVADVKGDVAASTVSGGAQRSGKTGGIA